MVSPVSKACSHLTRGVRGFDHRCRSPTLGTPRRPIPAVNVPIVCHRSQAILRSAISSAFVIVSSISVLTFSRFPSIFIT